MGSDRLDFRDSQSDPDARMRALLDGNGLASINVPDTNSFSVFSTVSRTITLPAARHVLRLALERGGAERDRGRRRLDQVRARRDDDRGANDGMDAGAGSHGPIGCKRRHERVRRRAGRAECRA